MGDGTRGQQLNRFDFDELMRIGKPFEIKFSWTASTTASYFTLDSTDYDDDGDGANETTPFKDQALIITAAKVTCSASATLSNIVIDEKSIYADLVGSSTLYLTGDYDGGSAILNGNVKGKYGRPWICNNKFGGLHSQVLTTIASDTVTVVKLWGYYVPRILA